MIKCFVGRQGSPFLLWPLVRHSPTTTWLCSVYDYEAAPQGVRVEELDGVGGGEDHSNNNPCVVLLFFLPAFGWCLAPTAGRFFSIFFTWGFFWRSLPYKIWHLWLGQRLGKYKYMENYYKPMKFTDHYWCAFLSLCSVLFFLWMIDSLRNCSRYVPVPFYGSGNLFFLPRIGWNRNRKSVYNSTKSWLCFSIITLHTL